MSFIAKISNISSYILVSLFLSKIKFVIKILVLARYFQLVWSSSNSYIIRPLIEKVFCYFCLKFFLFLALAMIVRIYSDRNFGNFIYLVEPLIIMILSLLKEMSFLLVIKKPLNIDFFINWDRIIEIFSLIYLNIYKFFI